MPRQLSQSDVQDLGRAKRLAPKVTDFIGRKGFKHRQEKRADGVVEDVVTWTPNVNGKKTHAAHEVEEAMGAHYTAETARQIELQGRSEHQALTAEIAATRNGHKIKVKGRLVSYIDRAGRYVRVED